MSRPDAPPFYARSRTLLVPATPPDPTPEYEALTPQSGESALDALARVGDGVVQEFHGSDSRDSRPNKALPRQLAGLVALRAQGFDNHEIAERLDISPQKLRSLIAKARKEYGWNDLGQRLADIALPQAVENVIKHLDHEGTAAGIAEGMSKMTIAVAGGLGAFKTHSAIKQESKTEETRTLRVEIVLPRMPPGTQGAGQAIEGVLATPRRALAAPQAVDPGASIVEGEVVR